MTDLNIIQIIERHVMAACSIKSTPVHGQVKTTVSSIAPKLCVMLDVNTASTFSSR